MGGKRIGRRSGDPKPMKVLLLRTQEETENNKSGIGSYADTVKSVLEENGRECEPVYLDLSRGRTLKEIMVDGLGRSAVRILKSGDADVMHAAAEHCSLLLPFFRGRKIVTLHHVIRDGEFETKSWTLLWKLSVLTAKIFADRFIAISPATKKDMVEKLGIPEEKITVILHKTKPVFRRTGAQKEKCVGFVGSLIDRKNPETAMKAFAEMKKYAGYGDWRFVVCGTGPKREKLNALAEELGISDSVGFVSNLSEEELCDLYNRMSLCFNTSLFEGFGAPILESQACGTPVFCLEGAEIPSETLRETVLCKDAEDMAAKAVGLLEDREKLNCVTERGIKHSASFSENYAESLFAVYDSAEK